MSDTSPFYGRPIICENEHAFAIADGFPVTPGHTLVVSRRTVADYFELSEVEQSDIWRLVNIVKHKLEGEYKPDGFNIGINIGTAAGQTVMHVHVHVIPRRLGDHPAPRGGVRGVIPGKANY